MSQSIISLDIFNNLHPILDVSEGIFWSKTKVKDSLCKKNLHELQFSRPNIDLSIDTNAYTNDIATAGWNDITTENQNWTHISKSIDLSIDTHVYMESDATNTTRDIYDKDHEQSHIHKNINFSIDTSLYVKNASDDEMQDIFPVGHISSGNREKNINLLTPLPVFYGVLDVRIDPIKPKKKRYDDLFVRKLPRWLAWKRQSLKARGFLFKKRYTFLTATCMLLLLIVPTLFYVKYNIEDGYNRLIGLRNAQNIGQVKSEILTARRNFERANFLFTPFYWIPNDMVDLADRAGKGGLKMTRSLEAIIDTIPTNTGTLSPRIVETDSISTNFFRAASKDIFFLDSLGIDAPTDWVRENPQMIDTLVDSWSQTAELFSHAKGDSDYAKKMRKGGEILSQMSTFTQEYKNGQEYWLQFLGSKTPQRYIVLNQNRDEIRANGGFPGSVITFTLYKGNILDYRSDDVYYYDWNLYPHKELPPPGIALMTDTFGLRDINYYPDFLQTLEKANDFVERTGEPTLTTAIAIHQGMIEDILAEIGPVSVENIPEDFTAENFSTLMSVVVEGRINGEKTPKDVLFQFIEAFSKKTIASKKYQEVFEIAKKYWQDGEILIASRDDNLQDFISKYTKPLPWNQSPHNWAYPVFTSISANKSDRYIQRNIQTDTQNLGNCTFKNTLRLSLKHTYNKSDEKIIQRYMDLFEINDTETRKKLDFTQGNGPNTSYLRLFVPQGATLLDGNKNVEVSNDENSTIFTTTMITPVGGEIAKTFSYQVYIPECDSANTNIDIVRQPGLHNLDIQ